MNLKEILDDQVIGVNLKAENKDQAITLLSQKLKKAGYIKNIDVFKKDIYYRESQRATGIGNYVAIPHGQSESVNNIGIAIGKFSNEISWETLDSKGVKIVFLFAVDNDPKSSETHLDLLSKIAGKLGNDETIEMLLKSDTVNEIKNVFLEEA